MAHSKGFALVAALMILALLSILGAAAIQSATLEAQISGHDRDARFSLYLAQSALREARYYAARGWGKASPRGPDQVVVDTPPAPGLRWDANLYQGFTLADVAGSTFPVLSHTDSVPAPTLTLAVAGPSPAAGRFTLFRDVPAALWDAPHLIVEDDGWATRSPLDCWRGWTLWNSSGSGFRVLGSSVCPSGTGTGQALRLRLSQDPGASPFSLSLNPWLQALAAGAAGVPGDADAAAPGWNRVFVDAGGVEIGRARVEAAAEAPGRYLLTATGAQGRRQRQVTARVHRAGRTDQRVADWTVP